MPWSKHGIYYMGYGHPSHIGNPDAENINPIYIYNGLITNPFYGEITHVLTIARIIRHTERHKDTNMQKHLWG